MRRLSYITFFVFFNIFLLQADQQHFDDSLDIGIELIDGCIDPITGSYLDREVDIAIPGAASLTVERKCNTLIRSLGETIKDWKGIHIGSNSLNMFSMWTWNHSTLTHWKRSEFKLQGLMSCNTNGKKVVFSVTDDQKKLIPNQDQFTAWSNCYAGKIGASLDLHNTKGYLNEQGQWCIQEQSRIKHIYGGPTVDRKIFFLQVI